ncbi:MAG TPA: 16S rRNA (guanine(527)-N(7))-methyltransferase RsmG [Pyrinomonadaceae bacterium]|nr:16S rRNA (guanine(527)-N(7))-methyltransferase RsmG [Pyrinomonadaceae bacterium]
MTNPSELIRFSEALRAHSESYEDLSPETESRLGDYFILLSRWNNRLHLVAPCSPEEFATRHILESLLCLRFLTANARVADIGSGAGLPIIPCLLARPDVTATLIESSQKKSVFLREALNQLGMLPRAKIVARRFEEVETPAVDFVTCRALDEFMNKVARLVQWAPASGTLLLFGGETLREQLTNLTVQFSETLIPNSEKRYLFVIKRF